ncbi:hypothetical protein MOQ72_38425 [Saccharopolyspora sp. K220]|nr:hypothetical protein [Saccharopolyspora soli]MCI2423312.1 hypothetical protein [Saccharopolyspora soli]
MPLSKCRNCDWSEIWPIALPLPGEELFLVSLEMILHGVLGPLGAIATYCVEDALVIFNQLDSVLPVLEDDLVYQDPQGLPVNLNQFRRKVVEDVVRAHGGQIRMESH